MVQPGEGVVGGSASSSGRGGQGWSPGVTGGLAQRGHDVDALFAGGVDVAAGVEAVLGGVFAGRSSGNLLVRLCGTKIVFADVVRGPDSGVFAEAEHVVLVVAAEFQRLTPGPLRGAVAGVGYPRHPRQPDLDRVAELLGQIGVLPRVDFGQSRGAGGVPARDVAGFARPGRSSLEGGMDEFELLRLAWRSRCRTRFSSAAFASSSRFASAINSSRDNSSNPGTTQDHHRARQSCHAPTHRRSTFPRECLRSGRPGSSSDAIGDSGVARMERECPHSLPLRPYGWYVLALRTIRVTAPPARTISVGPELGADDG